LDGKDGQGGKVRGRYCRAAPQAAALTNQFVVSIVFFLGPEVAGVLGEGVCVAMETAIYVGLSRQVTLQRALQITANNIANADTAGFKVEEALVREEALTPPSADRATAYVLDYGVARDFAQGSLDRTGNPLDTAIEGDALFAVQTPGGVRYTRDGRFGVDAQNRLITRTGYLVQAAGGAAITLNPAAGEPSIASDGTIRQGAVIAGRIETVRFANRGALSKEGDNLFSAAAEAGPPVPAPDTRIHQGMVEASNVKPVLEITNLIEITRTYERISKMMDTAGQLKSDAVTRLGRVS
jgi:flagellar basal-body rod protein FlgF